MFVYRFFFFNDTATTEIYTLSLHDALPIYAHVGGAPREAPGARPRDRLQDSRLDGHRSEEHTSELQSRRDLVCRLLLEKKKKNKRHKTSRNQTHNPNLMTTTRIRYFTEYAS